MYHIRLKELLFILIFNIVKDNSKPFLPYAPAKRRSKRLLVQQFPYHSVITHTLESHSFGGYPKTHLVLIFKSGVFTNKKHSKL
jgi:hypothetical protein